MSIAAATAASTVGAGLPSAYASGGSAIDATTDPSEMYFVSQTTTAKIASAGGNRQRRQHREDAAGGRDAFAAAEPQPDGIDVADDRREPRGRRHRRARAHARGEPHARRAFRHVEQRRRARPR